MAVGPYCTPRAGSANEKYSRSVKTLKSYIFSYLRRSNSVYVWYGHEARFHAISKWKYSAAVVKDAQHRYTISGKHFQTDQDSRAPVLLFHQVVVMCG